MYALARSLPPIERFNLVSQITRAATSMTNNIAEGYGRYHFQESIQFFRIARGSVVELKDDLNICLDEGYVNSEIAQELKQQADRVEQLINGYIRYLSRRKRALVLA
jgi:four helix bundle protein